MTDDETVRVNMDWPKGLKEEIRDRVGPRGMTEFTLDAVRIHLTQDGYPGVAEMLREAKQLAQRLANVLVTVNDPAARMQFLMSVELPEWIDMSTWPPELVKRIQQDIVQSLDSEPEPQPEPPAPAPEPQSQVVGAVTVHRVEPREPEPAPEPVAPAPESAPAPAPVASGPRGDLFARLQESGQLKPASTLPKPEPKAEEVHDGGLKRGEALNLETGEITPAGGALPAIEQTEGKPLPVFREPPEGWFAMGTHAGNGTTVEFSEETDEAGMPLWERPVTTPAEIWQAEDFDF